uniref:Helicase-associated domain-containing protein n=1 Tax=Minutocellus polymorphus TaxID=265543 RepID=A0A7S0FTR4_9STRA|mmetsp:Transcript_7092/g.11822  ORF Transcript_7092/g.11822 Transcript_7092/m.11822 type:complete len:102 (+) Transcript_7092:1-306(+)
MTEERIAKLEEIGFVWDASEHTGGIPDAAAWNDRHDDLLKFKKEEGHCRVPLAFTPNPQLGNWVATQRGEHGKRQKGRHSSITEDRIAKLEEIGFKWKLRG